MINFEDSEIKDILPISIRSGVKAQAISYAIKQQIQRILLYAKRARLYAAIDELPEEILDLLAVELRTQYYNQEYSADTKRRLVKNTLLWYTKAGTPAAVQELIEVIFGDGVVIDWYDYDGEPGYFKVQTTNMSVSGDKQQEFLDLLDSIKRESAWLDAVEIISDGILQPYYFLKGSIESSIEVGRPIILRQGG